MAKEKIENPKFTTPVGVLKYPSIMEPDYGNKEYPDPDGSYKTAIVFDKNDPAVKAMIAKLQPYYDQAIENGEKAFANLKIETRKKLGKIAPNPLFTELYDEATEEPTGEIEFRFKMKASGISKKEKEKAEKENRKPKRWNRAPGVFDTGSPMRPIPKGTKVWGGSKAKVSFTVGLDIKTGEPGYFIPGTGACGLKLALEGVQVFSLVSGGERSAADYGFESEDGGFTVDDLPEQTETKAEAETSGEDTASEAEASGGDDGDF